MAEQEIRITMTADQAVQLLDDLADNDDVRERFRTEPAALLEEYGIHVPPDVVPPEVTPPRREAVDAARQALREIRESPEGGEPYGPPWSPPPHAAIEPYKPFGGAMLMLFSFAFDAIRRGKGSSPAS